MATAAFNAQGTIIAREGTTPGTYTSLAEIRSFSGPGGSAAIIDATTLLSTGKEKVMGLMDEGQLTLEANFVPGDSGQQALLADRAAQLRKNFRITFSDVNNATATFAAYVMGFTVGGGVDALTTATITLEITGAVVWDFTGTP
jgi:tail tube protein